MIVPVGMGKGVQGIVRVHAELSAGDEQCPAGAQRKVAAAFADCSGADGGCGIISGSGDDAHRRGKPQLFCQLRQQGSHHLIAFVQLWQLLFGDAADGKHLLGPAASFDIQQQHTRSIGVVGGKAAGQPVDQIIFGQHDFTDARKVLRFVFLHPQDFGRGEAGKGDVCRIFGQLLLADGLVEVVGLCGGASVVPQDGRTDDLVLCIQCDQTVHLSAEADACYLTAVAVR